MIGCVNWKVCGNLWNDNEIIIHYIYIPLDGEPICMWHEHLSAPGFWNFPQQWSWVQSFEGFCGTLLTATATVVAAAAVATSSTPRSLDVDIQPSDRDAEWSAFNRARLSARDSLSALSRSRWKVLLVLSPRRECRVWRPSCPRLRGASPVQLALLNFVDVSLISERLHCAH